MTRNNRKTLSVLSMLLILVCFSFCKEKQEETKVEIKDKYALPPGYTGSLNPVSYDFEYPMQQLVRVTSDIGKFFGIKKNLYPGHCGLLDFEKKTFLLRITGAKKKYTLKVIYLGNHLFALVDDKDRGFVGKLEEGRNAVKEKVNYYYFYPLSEITNAKKINNVDPGTLDPEFYFSDLIGPEYKSIDDCEKEKIENEKVQQSIDEEHEKVKGDLAPP
ncbi:hypothetical protein [Leptospira interrogans]|uniref:hypothetical protein n=1 Tax=Leptospira interrogans TaxID=173 RepID=UPI0007731C8F|nr:hypothetical protein [Leptospira interrogans]